MLAFPKKIYTKEQREAQKTYFQQLMPQQLLENTENLEDEFETEDSNLGEKISNEEILALEGSGQTQLLKQSPGNGVDAFSVTSSSPRRSPQNIPPSKNGSKPPRFSSGFVHDPTPRTPPRIAGNQVNNGLGGNGGNGPFSFNLGLESSNPNTNKCWHPEPAEYPNPYSSKAKSQKKKKVTKKIIKLRNGAEIILTKDKNGNPIFTVIRPNGYKGVFTDEQMLQKIYHNDIYGFKLPEAVNRTHAETLTGTKMAKYVEQHVPREIILEFLRANVKSFATEQFIPVPGFSVYSKDPGMLFINQRTRQIHFFNDRIGVWRTTVVKSKTGLERLALNGFHLFPTAGKPA